MIKRLRYLSVLCLFLCLVLASCGTEKNETNDNSTSSDDNRVYAPTEEVTDVLVTNPPTDTLPEETTRADTTRPDYPSDIIIDPDPIYTSEDTEPDLPDETDVESDIPDTAEPTPVPEIKVEAVELGEAFLSGDPATGSLVSKESDKMRLVVNYNCERNIDGSINVDLQVGLECYDINCGARVDSGKLSVGGEVYTFSSDAIVHEEREMIFVPFASYNHQVAAGKTSLKIDASWLFGGVYAGVQIDTLGVSAVLMWDLPGTDDTSETSEESTAE